MFEMEGMGLSALALALALAFRYVDDGGHYGVWRLGHTLAFVTWLVYGCYGYTDTVSVSLGVCT